MIARKVLDEELQEIKDLLQSNDLPSSDLDRPEVKIFGFYENEKLIASGAIELVDGHRLLRSLCVAESHRRKGIGKDMVTFLESEVAEDGIDSVFIITEIPDYFNKIGYVHLERTDTPEAIQSTEEFTTLCTDTAIIMKNSL